jgi:ABC-type transporter Mla maintaining outer membrane lipid asymmetry ATPase subunit MlaF
LEQEERTLIHLNRVSLTDPDDKVDILHDISLEVGAGEKKFILARPYHPAVHLLRICATMYPPTSGTVTVFGNSTTHMNFNELLLIKKRIGFVERISSLISNISLLDNITLGLRYHHDLSRNTARRHVNSFLLHFDLLKHLNDRPVRVPTEKLRMALFCRELVIGPNLLILEKPSYGLSRTELKYVMDAILDYQTQSNCGIIISDDDAYIFTHTYDFFVHDLIDGRLESRPESKTKG